jgi:Tripartite tricarboxylate transporter TctB family
MQIRTANLCFMGFLLVLVGLGVYTSLGWPRETALLPYTIGSVAFLLLAFLLVKELIAMRRTGKDQPQTEEIDPDKIDTHYNLLAATEFAWLLGYGVAIWLVGFYPASFIYLLVQLHIKAKLALPKSLVWALLATGTCVGLFYFILDVSPYVGLIYARW